MSKMEYQHGNNEVTLGLGVGRELSNAQGF